MNGKLKHSEYTIKGGCSVNVVSFEEGFVKLLYADFCICQGFFKKKKILLTKRPIAVIITDAWVWFP